MLKQLEASYQNRNIHLYCASYLDADAEVVMNYYDVALSVMTLHHCNHEVKTELYKKHSCIKPNGIYIECDYMLFEKDYKNVQEMENFCF